MMEHLSAEEISQWTIGERHPRIGQHLAECEECRAELARLEDTLTQFRGAVRHWSAQTAQPEWREPETRASWFSWPRLALAAALLMMISLPAYWTARQRERAAEAARADAQLLEQVDSEISRAVPEPMEPLVDLVAWNSTPASGSK